MKTELKININEEKEKAIQLVKEQGRRILVCASTGCIANGALELIEEFKKLGANVGVLGQKDKMSVIPTGCIGFCEQGVLVVIPDRKITYVHVKKEDVKEIYESFVNDTVVERLLYVDPALNKPIVNNEEINLTDLIMTTACCNYKKINETYNKLNIVIDKYSNKVSDNIREELFLSREILNLWVNGVFNKNSIHRKYKISDFTKLIIDFFNGELPQEDFIFELNNINKIDCFEILNWNILENILNIFI